MLLEALWSYKTSLKVFLSLFVLVCLSLLNDSFYACRVGKIAQSCFYGYSNYYSICGYKLHGKYPGLTKSA